jgi:hypothetical protein
MAFFVDAKRPGEANPRPLAGPFTSSESAKSYLADVEGLAVRRHFVSTHSDAVYVGPECPAVAGRVGVLNRWLPGLPDCAAAGA